MTFTPEDLQALTAAVKEALKPDFAQIDTRLTTVETNLAAKIDKLRDETIEAIGDLADQLAIQKEVDDLTRRVEKLEHLPKTA